MCLLTTTLVVLGACSKSPPYAGLPKSEAQFCEAVDRGRVDYDQADENGNSIARAKAIDDAKRIRMESVSAALTNGSFVGWIAQVEKVAAGSSMRFVVRLPCQAKVFLDQSSARNERDAAFLGTLAIGSWVLVSGSFNPIDSADGFEELSATDSGSLQEPEYRAGFALIKPVTGPDDRYPDELQPKLVAAVAEHRAKFLELRKQEREKSAMESAVLNVCTVAQRAIETQVKNEVDFPSCVWSANEFRVAKVSETRFRIEGPFTYTNAFGAKMKASFRADVEEGNEGDTPLARYKVVDTKLID